MWLQMYT